MNELIIIDNNDSFTYNLVQSFKYIGSKPKVINISDVDKCNFNTCSKIVLSPGPGLPDENPNLINLIHKYKSNKKILGVCLGMQAIALAFGASLYNLDIPRHGESRKLELINASNLYTGLNNIEVGLYHSWAVNPDNLHKELIVSAVDKDGVMMSLEHSIYNIYAVQYHPESIITKDGLTILYNWYISKNKNTRKI